MATTDQNATIQLKRTHQGMTAITLAEGEPFYNSQKNELYIGPEGGGIPQTHITKVTNESADPDDTIKFSVGHSDNKYTKTINKVKQLKTSRYIDGVPFDGSSDVAHPVYVLIKDKNYSIKYDKDLTILDLDSITGVNGLKLDILLDEECSQEINNCKKFAVEYLDAQKNSHYAQINNWNDKFVFKKDDIISLVLNITENDSSWTFTSLPRQSYTIDGLTFDTTHDVTRQLTITGTTLAQWPNKGGNIIVIEPDFTKSDVVIKNGTILYFKLNETQYEDLKTYMSEGRQVCMRVQPDKKETTNNESYCSPITNFQLSSDYSTIYTLIYTNVDSSTEGALVFQQLSPSKLLWGSY